MVTPGTLTDSELLSDKSEAILPGPCTPPAASAWTGLRMAATQGCIHTAECAADELGAWLSPIAPARSDGSAESYRAPERFQFAVKH